MKLQQTIYIFERILSLAPFMLAFFQVLFEEIDGDYEINETPY